MINSEHPQYQEWLDDWLKCRNFYKGERAVKSAGITYLPHYSDEPSFTFDMDSQYARYKNRAFFLSTETKTVDAMVGLMTRKPSTIELPKSAADVDMYFDGAQTFRTFHARAACELCVIGRYGILVDRSNTRNDQLPYMVGYEAEQIINWYEEDDILQYVVLAEQYCEISPTDNYDQSEKIQYRELIMIDGIYQQRVWRKSDNKDWVIVEEITPTNRGRPLTFIPFVFINPYLSSPDIAKSPTLDMVNANNHHYIISADYAEALHYVALPTLYITGLDAPQTSVKIGGRNAIVLSKSEARVGYAEVSGQGIPSLERALEKQELYMAQLGSRLLFGSRNSGVEAAETVRLYSAAETASLTSIVGALEMAFQRCFAIIMDWENISGDIVVDLNKDFITSKLQPAQLDSLVKAFQASTISLDTLLFNLSEGEILPDGVSVEDEKAKIKNN